MTQPPAGSGSGAFGASEAPDAVPVCPRHPNTAAYTRCQRCGRPACPRCQIPASVGFQCVDCVAAERKTNPTLPTRSSLGMTKGAAAQGRPVVTIGIIAICCLVWLGQLASDALYRDVSFVAVFARDEPWRYLTSGFAHDTGTPMHLLFNMLALYFMGQYLEPLIGRVRFGALYLLSVLGGSVVYQIMTAPSSQLDLLTSGWVTPLVGASGGVFGLFLAVVVFNRRLGREIGPMMTMIAINVVIGFTASNVAWQAHLGGAVAGAVGALVLYALRRRPVAMQASALGALAVALIAAAYVDFSVVGVSWPHIVG